MNQFNVILPKMTAKIWHRTTGYLIQNLYGNIFDDKYLKTIIYILTLNNNYHLLKFQILKYVLQSHKL